MVQTLEIPQAPDISRAALGAALLEPRATQTLVEQLSGDPEVFYKPANSLIFRAIKELYENGEPVDQLSLTHKLREQGKLDNVGGEPTIAALAGEITSAANLPYHIEILKSKSALRKLLTLGGSVVRGCQESSADPVELLIQIESELYEVKESLHDKRLSITERIREFVNETEAEFFVTELDKDVGIVTPRDKDARRKAVQRLRKDGLIEVASRRRGHYRVVHCECDPIDWQNAKTNALDIRYPFGIQNFAETMPGNIVVVAGSPNSGKSAFLLNIAKMNMHKHDVCYYSSEMGESELKKRLLKFDDVSPDDWNFRAYERSGDFADVIRPGAINLIDFLEIHDEFWKAGGLIRGIHDKLNGGIAIIALQKNHGTDMGRGGGMTLEKPRIYLAMEPGTLKIVKAKNFAQNGVNPNGFEINFSLVDGCKFIPDTNGWVYGS